MRYVIYGACAIGGAIAARLVQAGKNVVAIARAPHLAAIISAISSAAPVLPVVALRVPLSGKIGLDPRVLRSIEPRQQLDLLPRSAKTANPS